VPIGDLLATTTIALLNINALQSSKGSSMAPIEIDE
jgi:hypothetical protein